MLDGIFCDKPQGDAATLTMARAFNVSNCYDAKLDGNIDPASLFHLCRVGQHARVPPEQCIAPEFCSSTVCALRCSRARTAPSASMPRAC